MAKLAVLAVAGALLAAVPAQGEVDSRTGTISVCAHYQGHVYEACFAFVVNCTYGAMIPYFDFGRSPNAARAAAARNRLESRYYGQARAKLEAFVQSFPKGEANAHVTLSIISAHSSLATNTATLRVRWSYGVLVSDGRLFGEANALHTITMKRVPGLILHKWVVTAIH